MSSSRVLTVWPAPGLPCDAHRCLPRTVRIRGRFSTDRRPCPRCPRDELALLLCSAANSSIDFLSENPVVGLPPWLPPAACLEATVSLVSRPALESRFLVIAALATTPPFPAESPSPSKPASGLLTIGAATCHSVTLSVRWRGILSTPSFPPTDSLGPNTGHHNSCMPMSSINACSRLQLVPIRS